MRPTNPRKTAVVHPQTTIRKKRKGWRRANIIFTLWVRGYHKKKGAGQTLVDSSGPETLG